MKNRFFKIALETGIALTHNYWLKHGWNVRDCSDHMNSVIIQYTAHMIHTGSSLLLNAWALVFFLQRNSLLHLEFKNSFWVGSGNGFLFVSPFSNWFSKNQCNGARIRIVRMIPWLSRIPPHKVLIVTSKQETTAHHLGVPGTFLEQLWKTIFSWWFWWLWDDCLDPQMVETANTGETARNHIEIGRNHLYIGTPHPLNAPGTFLEQFWKIDFSWWFWFLGVDFAIPFCDETLTSGQIARNLLEMDRNHPNHHQKNVFKHIHA